MRLKRLLRDYLSFSKTEVNGTLVLIPLIVLIILSPYFYRQVFGIKYSTQLEDRRLLDSLVSLIDDGFQEPEIESLPYFFEFNPNTASVDELNTLGIPKFLAKRIDNYRSNGGSFRVKRDLLKIFDFPDTLYRQLEKYIVLPSESKAIKVRVVKSSRMEKPIEFSEFIDETVSSLEPVFTFDLNEADTTELKRIVGIGPSYAKRIVGYRKLLGGFHSLNQLKEVYGMTDTLYQSIISRLKVSDLSSIMKVSINLATFKELLAHPYIDYEQTKEILNVKSREGKFTKPEDLFRLKLMDSIAIQRLIPYIRF